MTEPVPTFVPNPSGMVAFQTQRRKELEAGAEPGKAILFTPRKTGRR